MFDLPYILTHPLLAAIYKRHAELVERAKELPDGSRERRSVERRISLLEQYRLPKPDSSQQRVRPIVNSWGQEVGESSSLRRRFKVARPGRPEEHRIRVRAAFEDKLAHPELTWRQLSEKYRFQNPKDLERQVRLLRAVLKSEGIPVPQSTAYREAKEAFQQGLEQVHLRRPPE
jgi:hypothetical protein